MNLRARQMVQWLRVLAVLAENMGLVHSTNVELLPTYNSDCRGPGAFFWALKTLVHMWHIHK